VLRGPYWCYGDLTGVAGTLLVLWVPYCGVVGTLLRCCGDLTSTKTPYWCCGDLTAVLWGPYSGVVGTLPRQLEEHLTDVAEDLTGSPARGPPWQRRRNGRCHWRCGNLNFLIMLARAHVPPGTRWAAPAASGSHVGHAKCPCHAQQALHICNKTNSFVSFLAKL
jgi:hypothetical protein